MIKFVEYDNNAIESHRANQIINSNISRLAKDAQLSMLIFPSDSISLLFPDNTDIVEETAMKILSTLRHKLNVPEPETLTTEEDYLLGSIISVFANDKIVRRERVAI